MSTDFICNIENFIHMYIQQCLSDECINLIIKCNINLCEYANNANEKEFIFHIKNASNIRYDNHKYIITTNDNIINIPYNAINLLINVNDSKGIYINLAEKANIIFQICNIPAEIQKEFINIDIITLHHINKIYEYITSLNHLKININVLSSDLEEYILNFGDIYNINNRPHFVYIPSKI